MISLPRSAVARFRAVVRRGLPRSAAPLAVSIRSGSRGRGLEAVTSELAVRLVIPGRGPAETYVVAPDALDDVAGFDDGDVAIVPADQGQVAFAFEDEGVAQHRHFPSLASERLPVFPTVPRDTTPVDALLLTALAAAAPLAPKQATRYALNRLLLDGATGQVVATDSKQLFVQGRWEFPWNDNVLIPAGTLWTCRELLDEPVSVGRTESHLILQSGPWTIAALLDRNGRYPDYAQIMPKLSRLQTKVHFSDADRDLIIRQLPKLPVEDPEQPAATLVVGDGVEIQVGAERLALPTASATGPPVRLTADRRMLVRALRLSFSQLGIMSATAPAVFLEDTRQFLFMPLSPEVVASAPTPAVTETLPVPVVSRRELDPMTNGVHNGIPPGQTPPDPLTEAETVRGLLRDADVRMIRLISHLKHQRRQTRALQSAVASLRSLPEFVH